MTQRKHLTVKALDEKGQVEALIATYNKIDKDGDVTVPGFFGEQPATIVTAHNWGDIMLGKGVIRDTEEGAVFTGLFNLDDPDAAKLHSKLRFDMEHPPAQIEWSYAFDILDGGAEKATHDGTAVRRLQPLADGSPGSKIFEVSPVLVGAGEGTGTLSVKDDNTSNTITITNPVTGDLEQDATRGIKFADQADTVITAVGELVDRAEAIAELRATEGKHLGSESVDLLTQLTGHLTKLVDVLTPAADEGSLATVQAQYETWERRYNRN